jgi:hypothetical protein
MGAFDASLAASCAAAPDENVAFKQKTLIAITARNKHFGLLISSSFLMIPG